MLINIDEICIDFPYQFINPEQIQFLYLIKKLMDRNCHGVMGLALATEIALPLINFFFSYKKFRLFETRMIYCTTNSFSIDLIINKVKNFLKNRILDDNFKRRISCVSEKKSLCVNSKVSIFSKKNEIEDFCKILSIPKYSNKGDIMEKVKSYCYYFLNFQKNHNELSDRIWSLDNFRKVGLKKKICPYFLSKKIISNSEVLIVDTNDLFFNKILLNYSKKHFSRCFLFLENFFDMNLILSKLKYPMVNTVIIDDAKRGFLILKKKLFVYKRQNENCLNNIRKKKYLKNEYLEYFFDNFSHLNDIKSFSIGPALKNSIRIFHLLINTEKILNFFISIFEKKKYIKWSLAKFVNFFFTYGIFHGTCLKDICIFSQNLYGISNKLGLLQHRTFNGLKLFGNFMNKIRILYITANENNNIIYFPYSTKLVNILEPKMQLFSCDSSVLIREILEKFKIVFLTIYTIDTFENISFITDYKFRIFGDLKCIHTNNFVIFNFPNIKKNFFSSDKKDNFKKIKKSDFLFHNIKKTFFNGSLILFKNFIQIEKILKYENGKDNKNKIFKDLNVFSESNDIGNSIFAFQEFRLSCDLGYKSIFLGLYNGVVMKINLDSRYREFIFFSNKFKCPYSSFLKKYPNKIALMKKNFTEETFSKFFLNLSMASYLNYFTLSKMRKNIFFFLNLNENIKLNKSSSGIKYFSKTGDFP
jgi:DNA excision repair protein ERCC-2